MCQKPSEEGVNVAPADYFDEKPLERVKKIAKKSALEETITPRRIECQLHHFCDLALACMTTADQKTVE